MLYNLDWLEEAKYFPPVSEIPRLKGYADNSNLFEDRPSLVLKPYEDRLKKIITSLNDDNWLSGWFNYCPNYWQLSTIKTADLMIGDKPNIKYEKKQNKVDEALQYTDFFTKLNEMVFDNDSLGDCIVRPYIDSNSRRNFVSQDPSMWFPVVNPENIKEVKTDVLAWIVCTHQDANNPSRNKYELHAKIQNRGTFSVEYRKYSIKRMKIKEYTDQITGETFLNYEVYMIGRLLDTKIETATYSQLVIHIPSITTSRSVYGTSNYERITATVAEIAIRESLASFILDQNSAPRLSAPDSAFVRKGDRWVLKTGGRNFVVKAGEQAPIYITWDGNLSSNEERIKQLKSELYSLSEMGTVLNHDDINSSQGYEALEVKMINPKLKARRMCTRFEAPLKQLIAYLIDDKETKEEDISIIFNDGVPATENQTLDMAQKKKNLGVSLRSVLIEYFGLSEEEADAEVEKARQESADAFMEQFGAGRNGLFGGGKDDENASNNGETDKDEEDVNKDEKDAKNDKDKEE